ncbi:Protein FAM32A [Dillenia turbinata]|uniref:Protein FAM32A n=1 Tax=Dillenia turbinata TaxID=194707 RepID=A0AAN8VW40_9MAGN
MSGYENVVGGKLKLKGKALDVKAGGVKKKKKINKNKLNAQDTPHDSLTGEDTALSTDHVENLGDVDKEGGKGDGPSHDDNITPAERRYYEQREQIDLKRLAKTANKSHRDRIQSFNEYLANLSEHYDIPKVGPG